MLKNFFSLQRVRATPKNFFFELLALSGAKKLFFRVAGTQRSQKTFFGLPLPFLRPRVDVAGAEGVREYLKQRFVPGVGVCFLLVFVVEISAFGVALANGVLRVDGKLLCDVAVYCQAYNVARGGYVEFFFSHCCHPFFS